MSSTDGGTQGADPRALIVTVRFDPATFARLDTLRREHFPVVLNHLPAHLTLFHQLPGGDLGAVVQAAWRSARPAPIALRFAALRSLGRGVALEVVAPELVTLRAAFARAFAASLTPQDRNGFRPHVTIQNKVTPADARALLERLGRSFVPWEGTMTGIAVWRYLGGPWAEEAVVPFGEGAPAA